MSRSSNAVQHPMLVGFLAYGCSHLMLVALIGMFRLPLPGLWWVGLALIPALLLMRWLQRFNRADLAQLVGVQATVLAGVVLGVHSRELFSLWSVWI